MKNEGCIFILLEAVGLDSNFNVVKRIDVKANFQHSGSETIISYHKTSANTLA